MQKHTKIYLNHFGYTEADWIPCEVCGLTSCDIHHIHPKGMGGSKLKDNIENLCALCRTCHNLAHDEKISKSDLQEIHDKHLHIRR